MFHELFWILEAACPALENTILTNLSGDKKVFTFKWDLEHKNNSATSLDCGANCPVAWAT